MKIEYRIAPNEFRAEASEGEVKVSGMAVPYNTKIDYGGWFIESFKAGAFREGVTDETVLLANHQGLPYARVGGNTLTFEHKRNGLFFEALLDTRDSAAQSIAVKIERQDLTGVSVGFYPDEDRWIYEDDQDERIIQRATLHEISVTHNPAYKDTHVSKTDRSVYETAIENRNNNGKAKTYNRNRVIYMPIGDDLETVSFLK